MPLTIQVHARGTYWLLAVLMCALLAPGRGRAATSGIIAGHARFQFLTGSLVRMEYAPSGQFVDAPTAVVRKRHWPPVDIQTTRRHGWLIARTDTITLRYRLHSGRFAADNLKITWHASGGDMHAWHPGQVDHRNLGGLTYSLDNISKATLPRDPGGTKSPVHDIIPGIDVLLKQPQPGLLSRSGYAFIDDSHTAVWNAKTQWIEPRRGHHDQDWYLFAYGRDYPKVLRAYAKLCGPIPMIPRYTLGPWITDYNFEYFPGTRAARSAAAAHYGAQHLKDEVLRFRHNHIPLAALVLDFGWHNYGWQGGYDWNPLIPHPDAFLRWLHAHGLKVSLNDHPGYANTIESILSYRDSHAPAVLKALGLPVPTAPSLDVKVKGPWKFATDPHDQGHHHNWQAPGFDDAAWRSMHAGATWQSQGLPHYDGVAWYRTTVTLPATRPPTLYLRLGVSGDYQLFVNGQRVDHTHVQWPRWMTEARITKAAHAGRNQITVRIASGPRGGGIVRGPVAVTDQPLPPPIRFDLSNKHQADVFMDMLHTPLMKKGVNVWWVDGGSGAVQMPGLNKQLWTNRVFYDASRKATGERAFILSRYGGWGSERYPAFFTGDTYSQWPVLAYEVAFTARAGNDLIPYVSNDIGGFHGAKIPFDLYARWVEFGTFSPILRLHSAHENPAEGNVRMPWTYGRRGMALAKKYFTLRTRLIPYIYTYTWIAHTQSMPILRPLYLQYPNLQAAYDHPHEYFFGRDMLVAPVLDASGTRSVYLPPGHWIDFFSGKRREGNCSFTAHYATDATPVFVRAGAIIPERPASADTNPSDRLLLDIFGSSHGTFNLYEDDGRSFAYQRDQHAETPMTYTTGASGTHHVVIGPTTGTFAHQARTRACDIRIHAIGKPRSVSLNGKPLGHWTWDPRTSTIDIPLPAESIRNQLNVDLK